MNELSLDLSKNEDMGSKINDESMGLIKIRMGNKWGVSGGYHIITGN